MEFFNSSIELQRIVFLFGAVASLLYKKKVGVTPGGIIVPGILAGLLLTDFFTFLITIAITVLTLLFYRYALKRHALSNRWSSLGCISFSVIAGIIVTLLSKKYAAISQEALSISLIAPGLITISAKKYSFKSMAYATLIVTSVTVAAGILLATYVPYHELTYLNVRLGSYDFLRLRKLYIVVPVSLVASVFGYYRYGVRSGGYLIMPFLAVLAVDAPIQALLITVGIALSYFIVKLIQKHTLIIGLERFVVSLFCGYFVVTICDYIAIASGFEGYRPSSVILLTTVAVITNDLSLQPVKLVLLRGIMPAAIVSLIVVWIL